MTSVLLISNLNTPNPPKAGGLSPFKEANAGEKLKAQIARVAKFFGILRGKGGGMR
jgi:hypothetical protein